MMKQYDKPSIFSIFDGSHKIGQTERVCIEVLYTRDRMIGILDYHGDCRILGKPQKEAYLERVNKIKIQ